MVQTKRHMDTVVAYHRALQRKIRDSLNAVSFGPGYLPCKVAIGLVILGLVFLMVGILVITIRFRHVYLPDWDTQFLGPFFIILFLVCCSGAVYLVMYAKRRSNAYRREIVFRPMGDDGVVVIHKSTIPHEEKMKDQLKSGTTPHQVVRPHYDQKKGLDNNGFQKNGDRPDGRYDKRRDDRRHPGERRHESGDPDRDRYRDRRGPPDDRPRRPPDDRPRGPSDDRPRRPPGDRPRGPDERPRGPPGERPRGPPGDRPRGPPGDRPRGPPGDRPRGPPRDRPRGPRFPEDRDGPPRGPPGDRYRDDPRPPRDMRGDEERSRQRMEDDMRPPAYNDIDRERRPPRIEERERRERTPDMERQRVRTPDFERRGPDAYADMERRGPDRYRDQDVPAMRAPTVSLNRGLESESEL